MDNADYRGKTSLRFMHGVETDNSVIYSPGHLGMTQNDQWPEWVFEAYIIIVIAELVVVDFRDSMGAQTIS